MAKGKRMEAFWASVANLKRPQMKDAWSQTVQPEPEMKPGLRGEEERKGAGRGVKIVRDGSDDTYFPPQTWEFPEVGEEDLQEIIRKLEAGYWRLKEHKSSNDPVKQIKKAFCDISMDNCPPSEVVEVYAESDVASTASNPSP